jgi:hypothetical protein
MGHEGAWLGLNLRFGQGELVAPPLVPLNSFIAGHHGPAKLSSGLQGFSTVWPLSGSETTPIRVAPFVVDLPGG